MNIQIINTKTGKRSEPNMVMESKQEVIDTIAKKDFDKQSLIQNTCVGCPPNYSFRIKKGDPIQVIKTTNIGTLQTDVFYDLRKHNGKNYAMTNEEENKLAIKKSVYDFGVFSSYNLPNYVVEESTLVEKAKEIVSVNPNDSPKTKNNKNLLKFALVGLVGFVIYKLVKK